MADDTMTRAHAPTTCSGTLTQLYLGLVWLGTSMLTAYATITAPGSEPAGALGAAAAALPAVIGATLVTSASIGHAASSRFRGAGGRQLAGLGLGICCSRS